MCGCVLVVWGWCFIVCNLYCCVCLVVIVFVVVIGMFEWVCSSFV